MQLLKKTRETQLRMKAGKLSKLAGRLAVMPETEAMEGAVSALRGFTSLIVSVICNFP